MYVDYDRSTVNDTRSIASTVRNKNYYRDNKISGLYKDYDPISGEVI